MVRSIQRIAALMLGMLMLCNVAAGEVSVWDGLKLPTSPTGYRLSCELTTMLPFDDTRTGWLNGLLRNTVLVLRS